MNSFFIVAVDSQWGIAKDYKIPWHYKEDFAFFKEITQGYACVMGYNTFKEIATMRKYPEKNKNLLPGRTNFLISSKIDLNVNNDIKIMDNPDKIGLQSCPITWIGGKSIYNYAMDDYIGSSPVGFITRIKNNHDCDMFFDHEKLIHNFKYVENVKETDDFVVEKWERKDLDSWNARQYKQYER